MEHADNFSYIYILFIPHNPPRILYVFLIITSY